VPADTITVSVVGILLTVLIFTIFSVIAEVSTAGTLTLCNNLIRDASAIATVSETLL
jgi:hypothetical protein